MAFVVEAFDGRFLDGAVHPLVRLADHVEAHLARPGRLALEALAFGLIALDVRQTGDAVPLKISVQCRPLSCGIKHLSRRLGQYPHRDVPGAQLHLRDLPPGPEGTISAEEDGPVTWLIARQRTAGSQRSPWLKLETSPPFSLSMLTFRGPSASSLRCEPNA